MPTAGAYEAMAARFDRRADDLEALPVGFVTALTPSIAVGPYVEAVDATFQVSSLHLVSAARTFRDVATTCRLRAARCRSYTQAVDRYRARLNDPDVDLRPLAPPARLPWMEYG